MEKYPLISVIIPIYKVEQYLTDCIDSVINQSYSNLEIILIDDGSPDNCGQICDKYASLDNRITVVHKKNGGLSDARNNGLNISHGNYITFVDSDDFIHKDMISILYEEIKKNNTSISCIGINDFLYKDTIIDFISSSSKVITLKEYITYPFFMCTWGKLYSKNLLQSFNFPINRLHEDEFTTYKLLFNANLISYNPSKAYYYRIREGSIMSSKTEKFYSDLLDALLEQYIYFYDMKEFYICHHVLIRLCYLYNDYKKFCCNNQLSKKYYHQIRKKITCLPTKCLSKIKLLTIKLRLLRYEF